MQCVMAVGCVCAGAGFLSPFPLGAGLVSNLLCSRKEW